MDHVRLAVAASLETAAEELKNAANEEAKAEQSDSPSEWEKVESTPPSAIAALQQLEDMGFTKLAGMEACLGAVKEHMDGPNVDLNAVVADLLAIIKAA